MATSNLEVFVAAFSSEDEAGATLKDFRAMHREGDIDLIDAAVIVHTAEGKVHFHETADPGAKRWAARGAIAGGLIGLIFPPSILAGAAVGAAGGGIWGKVRDKGFSDEDLRAIGESIAVAEDRVLETLQRGIEGYRKIERRALDADASAQIVAAVEEESGAEG